MTTGGDISASHGGGYDAGVDALRRFAALLPVPFTAADRSGRSVLVNEAYTDLVGVTAEEAADRPTTTAVHPDDVPAAAAAVQRLTPGSQEEIEVRLRHADGHHVQVVWRLGLDPGTGLVLAVVIDVSDEREVAERLAHESRHDPLTGLANRLLVMSSLERWIVDAQEGGHHVGVALIDLDRFKLVNDRMGHRVGDYLLMAVAGRLRRAVPDTALVGRMGGDELIVLVPDAGTEGAEGLAARLEAVQGDALVLGRTVPVRTSTGVTVGRSDPEQLLHEADVAAYTAKAAGGGHAVVFDDRLRRRDLRRMADDRRVADALSGPGTGDGRSWHGVGIGFVPIRTADDLSLIGVQARAVLHHPAGDMPVTSALMEIVRRLGHVATVLDHMRAQALDAASRMPAGLSIHLTLDSTDFSSDEGVADVLDRAAMAGVSASDIVLELTEDTLLEDASGAILQLGRARHRGARIAIDRFGVGASSLTQLAILPLDVLKVDGSFVEAAHRLSTARTILSGLVGMGPALGVQIILDGIRTAADLELARTLGATLVQGPHVGELTSAEALRQHVPGGDGPRW